MDELALPTPARRASNRWPLYAFTAAACVATVVCVGLPSRWLPRVPLWLQLGLLTATAVAALVMLIGRELDLLAHGFGRSVPRVLGGAALWLALLAAACAIGMQGAGKPWFAGDHATYAYLMGGLKLTHFALERLDGNHTAVEAYARSRNSSPELTACVAAWALSAVLGAAMRICLPYYLGSRLWD